MAAGVDFFARQNLAYNYVSYDSQSIGTNLRLGFALTEEVAFQPRYSFFQQKITLPKNFNNCQFSSLTPGNGGPGVNPDREAAGLDLFVNARSAVTPTAKRRWQSAGTGRRSGEHVAGRLHGVIQYTRQ